MKVLVTGWFSFARMGASAGDLLTRDLVCGWLTDLHQSFDVALAPPFQGGVDWRTMDPREYSHVVFVCGPLGNGPPVDEMLRRFANCELIGVNLTMLQSLSDWNPFQLLLERDSSRTVRPDLAFLASSSAVPVVGTILIDTQPEYGARDLHQQADETIAEFIRSHNLAMVPIDTRLDENTTRCSTSAQVEALISHVDVVVTTRLHGLVLSLKNGVPAVAIDTVQGGAKVTRQARAVDWPVILSAEILTQRDLANAFEFCLTEAARQEAKRCRVRAQAKLVDVRKELVHFLQATSKQLS